MIGVNQHALLLGLDYIVFQDRHVAEIVRDHPAPKITHHRDLADVWSGIAPDFGFSGATAAWVAWFFGCAPILLCGMDGYTAGRPYWHSLPGTPVQGMIPPQLSWDKFRRMADCSSVRAMSGPLVEVFGAG